MRLIPLLAALIVAETAVAQPRVVPPRALPAGTSALGGTLSDAVSNEPIEGCTVRVSTVTGKPAPASTSSSSMITGPDGVYGFAGIADRTYHFMVECPSHLTAFVPAGESGGPPYPGLTLFKDQQRLNVDFKLIPGAKLRGRVVDHDGRPVAKTAVRIGGPFLANQIVMIRDAITKADGTFELDRLPGGEFALEIDVPPAPGALRSPLVYYPGVLTREEAGRVEVPAGKVTEGVVITVPAILDRSVTVRIPPPDGTLSDVSVAVIRAEPLMTRRLEIDPEGLSTIRGLIAGRYVAVATAMSGQERWADFQSFDFFEESIDVSLQPRPSGRIRGRIVADTGGVPPVDGASIGAVWMDNEVLLNPLTAEEGTVAIDGTFEIAGIFGRRILQLGRFDADWRIHAVMQGRSNVTTTGVDVAPSDTVEVTIIVRRR
jgi:hypothetical protein